MPDRSHNRRAYLDRVDRELVGLDFGERRSILEELADHYDDLQMRLSENTQSAEWVQEQVWAAMGEPAGVGAALRDQHLQQASSLRQAVVTGLPFLFLGVLLAQPVIHREFWTLWGQRADALMPLAMMACLLTAAGALYLRYRWSWLSTVIGFGALLTILPLTRTLDITSNWPVNVAWVLVTLVVVVPSASLFMARAGVQDTVVALLSGIGAYGVFALSLWVRDWAGGLLVVVPFLAIVLFRLARRRYWPVAGTSAMLVVWGFIFVFPMTYYGSSFGPIPSLAPPPEMTPVQPVGDWISLPLFPATLLLFVGIWLLIRIQTLDVARSLRLSSVNYRRQRA